MDRPIVESQPSLWPIARYLPVTAIGVAVICWLFAAAEIRIDDVTTIAVWNPITYLAPMFFHFSWDHFIGNIRLWIPFAIVFTLLTSDRHLLGLALTVNALTAGIGITIGEYGVGLSSVLFGVIAATLVRSVGIAMQNASMAALQTMLVTVLTPAMMGLFLLAILGSGVPGMPAIAHFSHLFGFLFGAAFEAIYVLEGHEDADSERPAPRRVGT